MNSHTDTQVKKMKMSATVKERAFENSTLRQFSRFECVQMKTTLSNEMIDSKTARAVHRVDSASDRERNRERKREKRRRKEQKREESRDRERRDREQTVIISNEA